MKHAVPSALVLTLVLALNSAAATFYVAADGIAPDGSTTAFSKIVDAYAAAASDSVASVVIVMPGLLTNQGSLVLSEPMVALKGYGPSASALGSGVAIVVQDEAYLADICVNGEITNNAARLFLSNVQLARAPTCATNVVGTFILSNDTVRVRNLAPAEELTDAISLERLNALTNNLDASSITTGTISDSRIDVGIARDTEVLAVSNTLASSVNTKTTLAAVSNSFILKSGDTMSGFLTLTNATGTSALHAASKGYADTIGKYTYDATLGKNAPDLYSALTNGAKTVFVPAGNFTSVFTTALNVSDHLVVRGCGVGVSKLFLNLSGNLWSFFRAQNGFRSLIFEDVELVLTNTSSNSIWLLLYNDCPPSASPAWYSMKNCHIETQDSGIARAFRLFQNDRGGMHNYDFVNCTINLNSGGEASVVCMGDTYQRTVSVVFRDTTILINAGMYGADSPAGLTFIQGAPLDGEVVLDNVVCKLGGSIQPSYPAIFFRHQGNPSMLCRLSVDHSVMETPAVCMRVNTPVEMVRLSDSKFVGTKGLHFENYGTNTYDQVISNVVITSCSFDCTTGLDFNGRILTNIDPVIVANNKFTGAPTNNADNVSMIWANNEVNGTLPTAPTDMGGNALHNVGDPSLDNDAATKSYVDAITNGLGAGGVTSVSASGPLASSGGATPTISLTGQVADANIADNITVSSAGSVHGAAITAGSVPAGKLAQGAVNSNNLDLTVDSRYLRKDTTNAQSIAGALTVPQINVASNWIVGAASSSQLIAVNNNAAGSVEWSEGTSKQVNHNLAIAGNYIVIITPRTNPGGAYYVSTVASNSFTVTTLANAFDFDYLIIKK